jgi:hypothetical protein
MAVPLRILLAGLVLGLLGLASSCGFPEYGGFGESSSSSSGSGTSSSSGTGGATGCTGDPDCVGDPAGAVCDPKTKACVECTPADDTCAKGSYCAATDKCEAGCKDDADCNVGAPDGGAPDAGPGLTCDTATHTCMGCTTDDQCAPGTVCQSSKCVPGCTPTHDCQTGRTCCGSQCTDLKTDKDHCGSCQTPCVLPGAVGKCTAGSCAVESCLAGFQDCNQMPEDGCESTKATDLANCGACGMACSGLQNATPACVGGLCDLGPCKPNFGDCDGMKSNGCETNLLTSAANCAGCGNACALPNAVAACANGVCAVGVCNAGSANCDNVDANGCEVDTAGDPTNCGTCGKVCVLPNAGAKCMGSTCQVQACAPPFGDCNLTASDGCEVNLNTDPSNCSMCGSVCNLPNATAGCSNGACVVAQCNMGFADCDGNPANGCEVNLNTSTGNCGGCGKACSTNNGTPSCMGGQCSIMCAAGFADCNMNVADGCEINTASNVNNCLTCGHVCPAAGGTPACVNNTCIITNCSPGLGDCDGLPGNGCETSTQTDPQNCGGCGLACFIANGTAGCVAGKCTVASCNPGFQDCDGSAANGCETNLKTNANCGGCGVTCSRTNGTTSCATGTCQLTGCTGTFANCDGNDANGCEVDTAVSIAHCGTCANACSAVHGAPACSGGSCSITCASGFGNCDADVSNGCETTTTNNVTDCGSCGNVCAVLNGTPTCSGTMCAIASCTAPFKDCDGQYANGCETNTGTSASNCGTCGTTCSNANGTTSCSGGACAPVCAPGFGDCDSNKNNGCETDTTSSLTSCGGCGMVCSRPNASTACQTSVCTLIGCQSGFADCDLNPANGCEIPLNTVSNCGACGKACTNGNGTTTCAGGACSPSCNAGFGDCDGNPNNGCEAPLNTVANCNACGVACAFTNASATCPGGTCTFAACNPGFGDCDGSQANGCETNTNTTSAHCGACNMPCSGGKICVGGSCVTSCPLGTADCNMNTADGCEVNTTTDGTHCGTCATACTTAQYCASSSCTGCGAGTADCDRNGANGCEVIVSTDPNNCGTCGMVCSGAPNANPTCTGSTCGIACVSGHANCDGNAANGCECSGNICCSGACQPLHINGLGQTWDDCVALGVPGNAATYTHTMAVEARAAWPFSGSDSDCSCTGGVTCVYRQTATSCAVWVYNKSAAGYVRLNTSSNSCYCATTSTPDTTQWK